jgi:hypothetical protein
MILYTILHGVTPRNTGMTPYTYDLITLLVAQTTERKMVRYLMNSELEGMWQEVVMQ